MTIIISQQDAASPRIGYDNLLASSLATVTASSEAAGYEKENAYDWRLYDWWKPATTGTHYLTAEFSQAVTADYLSVFGHDLHKWGASVQLQYSTNGGVDWLDATVPQAPTTGKVIFTGFDQVSANKWRVKLDTPTGPAAIGHVMFGRAMVFPRGLQIGFEPANLARKNEYLNNQGDMGAFLGRSLRRYGAETSIDLKLLDPAWVREEWFPFQVHAEKKPFVFSWDYLNHPDEAAFCWTEGDVPAPRYEHALYMSVSMKVKALTELA